jgi:nitrogen-specific signal transduction histidine kinase
MVLTPTYHVFEMYTPFQEATYLPLDLKSEIMQVSKAYFKEKEGARDAGYRPCPQLSGSAAKTKDGSIVLALTNVSLDKGQTVKFNIDGFNAKTVSGRILTSKKAEQNKVWVGLSKETAHQLGTPISSLMAWTQILHETYPDDELIPEMDKDVKRLQLIAERFSKIGSIPEPVDTPLAEMLRHVVDYMDRRTSQKVKIIDEFSDCDAHVMVNPSLFEWVLENLCKNAVDAMEGGGTITIKAVASNPVIIDVTDTGKGIEKKNVKNVFRPGFTTKTRGWGLGLSLAKRIVEEYHHGKIYVLKSEVGKGTTFRIEV